MIFQSSPDVDILSLYATFRQVHHIVTYSPYTFYRPLHYTSLCDVADDLLHHIIALRHYAGVSPCQHLACAKISYYFAQYINLQDRPTFSNMHQEATLAWYKNLLGAENGNKAGDHKMQKGPLMDTIIL